MNEIIELESLLSNERNPRFLRDKGFKDLCASIASFPTMLAERPIVVNSEMIALGGNMRMTVLKHLATLNIGQIKKMYYDRLSEERRAANDAIWGFVIESESIPAKWVKVAEFATEEEEREFIVKDNLQAGEWEMDILSADYDIAELSDWGLDVVWNDEETETAGGAAGGGGDKRPIISEEEEATPSFVGEVFIKRGDIIEITTEDNRYRIGCLDSTNETEIEQLMDGLVADMVFQDPPYNVSIKSIGGHIGVTEKGMQFKSIISQHDEFEMAAGEMSENEFTEFLFSVFSINYKFSKDGSIHYQCMDWKHIREIINAGYKAYHNPAYGSFLHSFKNMCVWNKDNGGMGTFYRSKHELVFVFKKCLNQYVKHTNNFMLGQPLNGEEGRYRTNVWDYHASNSFAATENKTRSENGDSIAATNNEMMMHPTVKPLQMVVDAILDCSNPSELVIDLFCGSGTTLCAGLKTKRNVFTNDISPKYAQTALKRAWVQCIEAGTPFTVTINGTEFDNFDAL